MSQPELVPAKPWWKFGHVWMVISGPAIVVVASFVTFYLAASGKDPVVDEDYYARALKSTRPWRTTPPVWRQQRKPETMLQPA
jgi:hypothetical protein